MKKILVVVWSNICKLANRCQAVLRKKANQLEVDVIVDSAGTISFFIKGNPQTLVQSQRVRNVVTASRYYVTQSRDEWLQKSLS